MGVTVSIDKSLVLAPEILPNSVTGAIDDAEMWRVFNMGVGMVVITSDSLPDGWMRTQLAIL